MDLEKEVKQIKKDFKKKIEESNPLLLRINRLEYKELNKIYMKVLNNKYSDTNTNLKMQYKMFSKSIEIVKDVMFELGYIEMDDFNLGTIYVKTASLVK